MSVFTKVSYAELRVFLQRYPLGQLLGFQGIGEGVENSNFFLDTADGRWVLTLFERLNYRELPFFLALMDHFAGAGLPCPRPLRLQDGSTLTELNGKPAAIVNRLTGQSLLFPDASACAAVGALLGRMHRAGAEFPDSVPNSRGAAWRAETLALLIPAVDVEAADLLRKEQAAQAALDLSQVPQGVIHADLFRDNVLFVGNALSGVIDFYYACNDALLYDLAVTVNDWCFRPGGRFDTQSYSALIKAYAAERPLQAEEHAQWALTLRAAALRFYLSRLQDWHFPRAGDVVHVKDPAEYRNILEYHAAQAPALN